jgi:hypothetical protein
MNLHVPDAALDLLRPMFVDVEGHCEVWTDEEIARRLFIRGAMEYAKSAGKSWDDVMAVAAELRTQLGG